MATAQVVGTGPRDAQAGQDVPRRPSALSLSIYLSKFRSTERDPVVIAPSTWQRSIMGLRYNSRNGHGSRVAFDDMRATYLSLEKSDRGFVTKQLEDLEGRVWYVRPERLFDRRGYPASPVHLLAWLRKQDNWLEV